MEQGADVGAKRGLRVPRRGRVAVGPLMSQAKEVVMTVYLLNALSPSMVAGDTATWRLRSVSLQEVRDLLGGRSWVSAVGHQATAEALGALLGMGVPVSRTAVSLRLGDTAVVVAFPPGTRLPEGKVLTREEVEALGMRFWLVEAVLDR